MSGKGETRETDKSIVSGVSQCIMFTVLRSEYFERRTLNSLPSRLSRQSRMSRSAILNSEGDHAPMTKGSIAP